MKHRFPPSLWFSPLRVGALIATCALSVSCVGDGEPARAIAEPSVERALGGGPDLQRSGLRVEAAGTTWIGNEGYRPPDREQSSSFHRVTTLDGRADRVRIDVDRTLSFLLLAGTPQSFRVVVDGDHGGISTGEDVFGNPGGPMLSARLAATRRLQRLLYPHALLAAARRDGTPIRVLGAVRIEGRPYLRVQVRDAVSPIDLFVDLAARRLAFARTVENNELRRDIPVEVSYHDWRSLGRGASLPFRVTLRAAGLVVHDETRLSATLLPELPADTFAMPAEATPPIPFDPVDGLRGLQGEQTFEGFANLGLRLGALDPAVDAQELSPGVFYLRAGLHNQLVVEQDAGVVVIETPLRPERSTLVRDWIRANIPGKPITHAIVTHHHEDHSAGARTFGALGAALVVGADSASFWRDTVLRAPSTVRPDLLAPDAALPRVLAVGAEPLRLPDSTHPISVLAASTSHAADMTIIAVTAGAQTIVFESDLFNTQFGSLVPDGALAFIRALKRHGLVDAQCAAVGQLVIAAGHGVAEPYEATLATMRALHVDLSPIGCQL
ncbi:MAG: MBL fold metallo-hydrolase [Kofleriaceae bacterium]